VSAVQTHRLRWLVKDPEGRSSWEWTWYETAASFGRFAAGYFLFVAVVLVIAFFVYSRIGGTWYALWYEANGWQEIEGGLVYRQMENGDHCYMAKYTSRSLTCVQGDS
jgi:hypothetical protein